MLEINSPPRLHIHPLPQDAILARISVDDTHQPAVRIDTWMRDGWTTGHAYQQQNRGRSSDDFIETHCQHCSLYFDVQVFRSHDLHSLDFSIEIDNVDVDAQDVLSIQLRSPCPCYRSGLPDTDYCASGIDITEFLDESDDDDLELDPLDLDFLRFSVTLRPDDLKPYIGRTGYTYTGFKAAMQRIAPCDDGEWRASSVLRVANAHGGDAYGEICWGYGTSKPSNLADCAHAYAKTPANDDLLPIREHIDNHHYLDNFDEEGLKLTLEPTLFELHERHALLLASATPASIQAFLLLGSSHHCQLINHPGMTPVVALFATWQDNVLLPDGRRISCYVSEPFPDGTRWLALPDPDDRGGLNGQLIGQLALSTPTPTPAYA